MKPLIIVSLACKSVTYRSLAPLQTAAACHTQSPNTLPCKTHRPSNRGGKGADRVAVGAANEVTDLELLHGQMNTASIFSPLQLQSNSLLLAANPVDPSRHANSKLLSRRFFYQLTDISASCLASTALHAATTTTTSSTDWDPLPMARHAVVE